jgi:hypothetical protein
MDTYVKRLEDLQGIAESFTGVEKSFAVQAGREPLAGSLARTPSISTST